MLSHQDTKRQSDFLLFGQRSDQGVIMNTNGAIKARVAAANFARRLLFIVAMASAGICAAAIDPLNDSVEMTAWKQQLLPASRRGRVLSEAPQSPWVSLPPSRI